MRVLPQSGDGRRRRRDVPELPHVKLIPEDDAVAPAVVDHRHLELKPLFAPNLRRRRAKVKGERGRGLGERLDDAPLEGLVHVDLARGGRPHEGLERLHVDRQPCIRLDLHAHRPHARRRRQHRRVLAKALLLLEVVDREHEALPQQRVVDVVAEHEIGLRVQLVVHTQRVVRLVQHREVLAARHQLVVDLLHAQSLRAVLTDESAARRRPAPACSSSTSSSASAAIPSSSSSSRCCWCCCSLAAGVSLPR